jgi:chromosome segregation ATPase
MRDEKTKGAKITKEMLRRGIKEAASVKYSPPPFMQLGSPIKTPTKLERSPPSKELNHMKLKELKHLKVQLENERYERNLLEVEVKQNQEKIDSLVKKCSNLSRELQSMKNHETVESNDENNNPNAERVAHLKAKMEKEITARDDKICDLKLEISDLSECKQSLLGKINVVEKERKELLKKLCDFDESVCALNDEVSLRDQRIQYLEQSNEELVQILSEYRQKSVKDISSDCLDFSCSTYHTGMSSSEGENLGSVIDLQLKDKELEVATLKEQLEKVHSENEELKSKLSSLDREMKENEELRKAKGETLNHKIDILKEKLKDTIKIHAESQKKEKELEETLQKEKEFNDNVNKNVDIMYQKLQAERIMMADINEKYCDVKKELEKVTRENEELKVQQSQKFKDLSKSYEEKFETLKDKMVSKILKILCMKNHPHLYSYHLE